MEALVTKANVEEIMTEESYWTTLKLKCEETVHMKFCKETCDCKLTEVSK